MRTRVEGRYRAGPSLGVVYHINHVKLTTVSKELSYQRNLSRSSFSRKKAGLNYVAFIRIGKATERQKMLTILAYSLANSYANLRKFLVS